MSAKVQEQEPPSAAKSLAPADDRLLEDFVAALAPRLLAALEREKATEKPPKIRADRPVSAKLKFRRPTTAPSDLLRTKARAICRRMGLPMRTD